MPYLVGSVVAVTVALIPAGYLVVRTLEVGGDRALQVLLRAETATLVLRSVALAVLVTVACLVLGTATAWLVVRTDLPGRRVFAVLAALPLAVPTYVAAYTWISLSRGLEGLGGAVLVLTLCSYPYVYLTVAATLRGLDPALEEVARALGSGPWRTFLRVTLPQLRPALAGGGLLVALYVLSDFGAVSVLRFDSFTRVVFTAFTLGFDRATALVLSTVLVAVTTLVVLGEAAARGRARYARVGAGAARTSVRLRLGRARRPAVGAFVLLAAAALGVPAASLAHWTVVGASSPASLVEVAVAAAGSVWVSLLGAALTLALALPVGLLAARHPGRLSTVLEGATFVPHGLPGLVVGLSLVFFGVSVAYPLYQTTVLLVVGYAVLFLPLAVTAVHASAAQSSPRVEEVARSLGRGRWHVARTVTVPLVAPGIGSGAVLVFLTCMKELPATLLLRPTGLDTLATRLWAQTEVSAYGAAAPYALLLVALSAVPAFLLGQRASVPAGPGDR